MRDAVHSQGLAKEDSDWSLVSSTDAPDDAAPAGGAAPEMPSEATRAQGPSRGAAGYSGGGGGSVAQRDQRQPASSVPTKSLDPAQGTEGVASGGQTKEPLREQTTAGAASQGKAFSLLPSNAEVTDLSTAPKEDTGSEQQEVWKLPDTGAHGCQPETDPPHC